MAFFTGYDDYGALLYHLRRTKTRIKIADQNLTTARKIGERHAKKSPHRWGSIDDARASLESLIRAAVAMFQATDSSRLSSEQPQYGTSTRRSRPPKKVRAWRWRRISPSSGTAPRKSTLQRTPSPERSPCWCLFGATLLALGMFQRSSRGDSLPHGWG